VSPRTCQRCRPTGETSTAALPPSTLPRTLLLLLLILLLLLVPPPQPVESSRSEEKSYWHHHQSAWAASLHGVTLGLSTALTTALVDGSGRWTRGAGLCGKLKRWLTRPWAPLPLLQRLLLLRVVAMTTTARVYRRRRPSPLLQPF
jgi:hypothetical protein